MLAGTLIVVAFVGGMFTMFHFDKYYTIKIIDAAKGRNPYEKAQRSRRREEPMLNEDEHDKLMREGHIEKRR